MKGLVEVDSKRYFFKIGEKVSQEKEIYKDKFFLQPIFLAAENDFEAVENGLVLPYFSGYTLDEIIHENIGHLKNITDLMDGILAKISDQVWLAEKTTYKDQSDWIKEYINKRVNPLFSEVEFISFGRDKYSLDEFFNLPTNIIKNGIEFHLPSINQMVANVVKLLDKFQPPFLSRVLGDFQPMNIIIGSEDFKVIDLSNTEANRDAAMDIGKFFNFLERFYLVSFIRDGLLDHKACRYIQTSINNGSIQVNYEIPHPEDIMTVGKFQRDFFDRYAEISGDNTISSRASVYKFITNLITFRRHLQFSNLHEKLIAVLLDSYLDVHSLYHETYSNVDEGYFKIKTSLARNPSLEIIDEIFPRTETLLKRFLSKYGSSSIKIRTIQKAPKSIYGCVDLFHNPFFFKIAPVETIKNELNGYKEVTRYPNMDVLDYHLGKDYGIYIQEYCPEVEKEGLMLCTVNKYLFSKRRSKHQEIITASNKIYNVIGENYQESLCKKEFGFSGPNDAFFFKRLGSNGRIKQRYSQQIIKFESLEKEVLYEDFLDYKIFLKNSSAPITLRELLSKAEKNLNPYQVRYFVLSPGDLAENNITIKGNFFDFEVAGWNSLIQDIAISCSFLFFITHYTLPRYESVANASKYSDPRKFFEKIKCAYQLDPLNKSLQIELEYPFPSLMNNLLNNYTTLVVKRINKLIPNDGQIEMVQQFKSALFLRLFGVHHFINLKEVDKVIILGLITHFMAESGKAYKSIPEYIEDKFISLK